MMLKTLNMFEVLPYLKAMCMAFQHKFQLGQRDQEQSDFSRSEPGPRIYSFMNLSQEI
jgi:hypothetical protein